MSSCETVRGRKNGSAVYRASRFHETRTLQKLDLTADVARIASYPVTAAAYDYSPPYVKV